MTITLPHQLRGKLFGLQPHEVNALFRELEKLSLRGEVDQEAVSGVPLDQARADRDNIRRHYPYFARIVDFLLDQQSVPMQVVHHWEQRQWDPSGPGDWTQVLSRGSSIGGDDFAYATHVLTAPTGLVLWQRDTEGFARPWWVSVPQVYVARITTVTTASGGEGGGPFNAHYGVETVDQAITVDTAQMTTAKPVLDRWEGIDYVPRSGGDEVLLLVPSKNRNESRLLAFETPNFTDCSEPTPVGGAGSVDAGVFGGFG